MSTIRLLCKELKERITELETEKTWKVGIEAKAYDHGRLSALRFLLKELDETDEAEASIRLLKERNQARRIAHRLVSGVPISDDERLMARLWGS